MTFRSGFYLLAAALLLSACGTKQPDRVAGGAGAGAAAGATVGAIFGGVGALPGALVGAAIGGGTGAATRPEDVDIGRPIWSDG